MERKVAFITNNINGLYAFRRELVEALVAEYEVCILAPNELRTDYFRQLGCKMMETPMDRHGVNPFHELQLLQFYKQFLRRENPDIVFTYTIKPNVYAGMACASLGIPYVANVTGLGTAVENGGLMQKITLALYRFGLRKAQKVFFQNADNRDFLVSRGIIRGAYGLLPGSGVNLIDHCYEAYPSEENGIRFLFVGRIMRDKGIEEYLTCAKRIHEEYPLCEFHIIGSYEEEKYRTQIEQFVSEGIIHYFGRQNDVHSFMKSHHVLIQPSYHEGLSNVLLEAAACGRPVIASNIPGCRETFVEGVSGFGFEPKNSESLIRAVEKMLARTTAEREKMGKCGRQKVEREFSRQLVIDAYIKELQAIQ